MAYALVGSVGTVATGSGASMTAAFAQSTTAGDLLIAWVVNVAGGIMSTSSTGWSKAVQASTGTAPSVFYKPNCAAGEAAPVITQATGSTWWMALAEFSGGAAVSPFDKSGTLASGTTSPVVAVCGSADATSGELFMSCGVYRLTMSATITTVNTYNNGATPTSNLNNDATSSFDHYRFAWGVTTGNAAADQVSTAITGGVALTFNTCVASFKLAAAAAAAIPDVGMALTVT